MKPDERALRAFAVGVLTLLSTAGLSLAQTVLFTLCPVGDPGNKADTTGYGNVSYNYQICKYDVTLQQYAEFLNAVAAQADPFKLYNSSVAYTNTNYVIISSQGGILQLGEPGNYSYAVAGDGKEPVTFVNWLAAARFCNWVENGEPRNLGEAQGSTETGSYTINGDTTAGLELKNAAAKWWIPSESEWYKAAYYDPYVSGSYWTYATQSKAAPGNVVGGGTNEANYFNGVYSTTQSARFDTVDDYLTPAGAFTNSASYYGTYDQAGDVYNWNDAVFNTSATGSRGLRGGSWFDAATALASSNRGSGSSTSASNDVGFRLAASYAPPAGIFAGLLDNAGLIKIDLGGRGTFTGDLILSDTTHALKGDLTSGTFSGAFGRARLPVAINLDEINAGNCILTGTAGGQAFTAYHESYGFARIAAERGRYTISLSATATDPTIPQDPSAASISVSEMGGVLMGGHLPDGERFRVSNVLVFGSAGNNFLVYKALSYPDVTTRGERGSLSGSLNFQQAAGTIDVSGTLEWVKPPQKRGMYPAAIDTGLVVTGTLGAP
ncbi:MAG: SUMF1/EgtB/PvdO family nonheme iron enzyme [Chthoniobacteraceae bacterium]|jgi:formylglycine-generating enzyme required for sulfatase activity